MLDKSQQQGRQRRRHYIPKSPYSQLLLAQVTMSILLTVLQLNGGFKFKSASALKNIQQKNTIIFPLSCRPHRHRHAFQLAHNPFSSCPSKSTCASTTVTTKIRSAFMFSCSTNGRLYLQNCIDRNNNFYYSHGNAHNRNHRDIISMRYSLVRFASTESEQQVENDSNSKYDGNGNGEYNDNYDPLIESHEFDVILNGLNEAQVEAVTQPTTSITRVVAGPGAGKTRVLTCRIAYLLKRDSLDDSDNTNNGNRYNKSSNSRILAVTFTKKAASEMQQRLDALLIEDEQYQNDFKKFNSQNDNDSNNNDSGGESDDIVEEVAPITNDDSNNRRQLPPLLTSRVTLGTFHSICAKILRWHGQELSKLPVLQNYMPKNDGQSQTAVLDGSFAIIDQSEQLRIVKQCLTDLGIDLKKGRGQTSEIRPITILNAIGQLKSNEAMGIMSSFSGFNDDDNDDGKHSKSSSARKFSSSVMKIAHEIHPLYRKTLLAQNSLDFDDLILLARELLKTNSEVRERMQRRWRHILVDEFQDTSEVQLDLVKLLSTSSLLVVGDGDQSIYSWRGAHAESMSDFVNFYSSDDSEKRQEVNTVFLMENYRSTTNIVKAAQKVISNPSNELSPQDSVRQDMKPMRGKGPPPRVLACADAKAEATFVANEINKMLASGTIGPSSTVALIYRTNAQSRALEEACVQNNLQYLVRGSAGTFYSRAEIKDCLCFLRWIYNRRDHSAMLRAMKTPSRGLGDVSIKEFITYCDEVEKHYNDKDQSMSTKPLDVLLSLTDSPPSLLLSPDDIISKRTLNKLIPFANQMKNICNKAETQTVAELLVTIIDTLDLKSHFDSISKTRDEFADRMSNVMELRSASGRYSKDGPSLNKRKSDTSDGTQVAEMSPLGNFLDDVSLLTDVGSTEDEVEDGERRLVANLMTIHASKGMEFDVVYLVGCEEGTFPTQRSISEGEGSIELDEERRLCYVAMTRAKTYLIMTWRREVQQFFGQGFKFNKAERSRFLDALVAKGGNKKKKNTTSGVLDPKRKKKVVGDSRRSFQTSTKRKEKVKSSIKKKRYVGVESSIPKQRSTKKRKLVKRKKSFNEGPPALMMDSSLFYPVGTKVHHRFHGEGLVQTPKAVPNGEKMVVTVKFSSGMQVDFPLENTGLTMRR